MKTDTKQKMLPGYFIPAWSAQNISYAISFIVLGYLTYYCTNTLGLSAGLVGILLLISKLFDGVTDLIAAVIIERTNTKLGKARPYLLLMIPAWIFIIIMFSTPDIGIAGKAFFIFICYFIINSVCITLVYAAEPVHLARALKNPEDSSTVLSIGGMIASVASMVVGIIFPFLITSLTPKPHGWTILTMLLGIPCMILSLVRFGLVKERTDIPVTQLKTDKKFGFRDMVHVIAENTHILILVLIQLLANVFSGLGSGVGTYYFQYIIGNINLQSLVAATSLVSMVLPAFIPSIIKKTSVKKVMFAGILMGIIGNFLRIIPNIPILIIGNLMTSIAVIPTGMLIPSLLIDCMDYNEWKTGERVEAVFGSVNAFAMKLGGGLASVLVGAIMGLTGYNGLLETQSVAAEQGIIALYSWIPALMFIVMFVTLRFYKIDEEMPKVRKELELRRRKTSC